MGLCDKLKHTQAPWRVYESNEGLEILTNYGEGSDQIDLVIADLFEDALPEREANADLIAAAPEMLELICDWYDFTNQGYQTAAETEFIERAEGVVGKAKDWD